VAALDAPLLDLFQRNAPQLLTQPGTRVQIEQLAARLIERWVVLPGAEC